MTQNIEAEDKSMKYDDKPKWELTIDADDAKALTASPHLDDKMKVWNDYTGESEYLPRPPELDAEKVAKVHAATIWANNGVDIDPGEVRSELGI